MQKRDTSDGSLELRRTSPLAALFSKEAVLDMDQEGGFSIWWMELMS